MVDRPRGTRTTSILDAGAFREALRAQAASLRIPLFGVASADPPPEAAFLEGWLKDGYAGALSYMKRHADVRADARRLLANARSVLCFGVPHTRKGPVHGDAREGRAFIARYAWGRDYHNLLHTRLRKIARTIRNAGFQTANCVDTKPLLEKAYAQAAGLGFIGKNTLLIHPKYGSHVHLGFIVTDLELPPDNPVEVGCGTCARCLPACPTGAFPAPFVLDAGKCLSHHTIEKEGRVPERDQLALGRHLFGCDLCQDVCPFNTRAPESTDPDTAPREERLLPELSRLGRLDERGWLAWTEGSALRRQTWDGFKRMVALLSGRPGISG